MSASCDLVPKFAEGLVPIGGQTTYRCRGGDGPLLHGYPQAGGPQEHLPDVRAVGEPARQMASPVHELDGRGGKKRAGP